MPSAISIRWWFRVIGFAAWLGGFGNTTNEVHYHDSVPGENQRETKKSTLRGYPPRFAGRRFWRWPWSHGHPATDGRPKTGQTSSRPLPAPHEGDVAF